MGNTVRFSKSGVSWTDYSWGIVDGCTKVSEACQNCYAEAMATRFWKGRSFSEVKTHQERLGAPLNTKKGGKVFVAPMGDLFHESIPFEFIDQVFAVMALSPQHTFQVLTKRPERMLEWFNYKDMAWRHESMRGDERIRFQTYHTFGQTVPSEVWQWPLKNVWLGVTAENQEQADKRIPILLQIPAAVRFISIEPMLGPVDLTDIEIPAEIDERNFNFNALTDQDTDHFYNDHAKLDLVICGGESGPHARPMHPDWARSLRDQCTSVGVAFYFKQWGEWVDIDNVPEPKRYEPDGSLVREHIIWAMGAKDGPESYAFDQKKDRSFRVYKVGTKKAGCLLDGREWKQMPKLK